MHSRLHVPWLIALGATTSVVAAAHAQSFPLRAPARTAQSPRFLAVGRSIACGINRESALQCWSRNGDQTPLAPPPRGRFSEVVSLSNARCALDESHHVQCWYPNPKSDGWTSVLTNPPGEYSSIHGGGKFLCGLAESGHATCFALEDVRHRRPELIIENEFRPLGTSEQQFSDIAFNPYSAIESLWLHRDGGISEGVCDNYKIPLAPVANASNFVAISEDAGLKSDGTLWKIEHRAVREQIPGLFDSFAESGCALTKNKHLYCGGDKFGPFLVTGSDAVIRIDGSAVITGVEDEVVENFRPFLSPEAIRVADQYAALSLYTMLGLIESKSAVARSPASHDVLFRAGAHSSVWGAVYLGSARNKVVLSSDLWAAKDGREERRNAPSVRLTDLNGEQLQYGDRVTIQVGGSYLAADASKSPPRLTAKAGLGTTWIVHRRELSPGHWDETPELPPVDYVDGSEPCIVLRHETGLFLAANLEPSECARERKCANASLVDGSFVWLTHPYREDGIVFSTPAVWCLAPGRR